MNKQKFHKIALTGRAGVPRVKETLTSLKDYLLSLNLELVLEQSTAELLDECNLPIIKKNDLHHHADLLIVVGGDGSLLQAAHMAVNHDLPVLGINRGRLGFLTDIHPNELNKISNVLNGHYQLEKRFFLTAEIQHDHNVISKDIALNDVVLLPGDVAQMIEFATYINNQFVCSQRADGLIIASPTGSTAYALSGGGPILHPTLDAFVLVPMFPHTLSSRPIVVEGNSHIKIIISKNNTITPYVSCDGQKRIAMPPGGELVIHKNAQRLLLIHPDDYNYFATLREKLGWEKRAKHDNEI